MRVRALAFAGSCLALGGCFFDTDPEPIVVIEPNQPAGSLVVRWTINGAAEPSLCSQSSAQTLEVRVFDTRGSEHSAWQQSCHAFSTSIPLAAGSYSASALLLDATSSPRTTEVAIAPFTIRGNDALDLAVDFPADSFF